MKDETYIIDICDRLLGRKAKRQHRFSFLFGFNEKYKLPVDAYYEDLALVIEYRERQHSEPTTFFDKRMTNGGIPRGQQRSLYDQRRRDILPQNNIKLIELDYSKFDYDSRKRLRQNLKNDEAVIKDVFKEFLPFHPLCLPTAATSPLKGEENL